MNQERAKKWTEMDVKVLSYNRRRQKVADATRWVWEMELDHGAAKDVLLALLNYCDSYEGYVTNTGNPHLRRVTRLADSTISAAIKWLREKGYITRKISANGRTVRTFIKVDKIEAEGRAKREAWKARWNQAEDDSRDPSTEVGDSGADSEEPDAEQADEEVEEVDEEEVDFTQYYDPSLAPY